METGTSSPALSAVSLATEVSWLVTVVSTVVIIVTEPELGNTFPIVTGVLCLCVAGSVMTDFWVLVRPVQTVCIPVTFPGIEDTATITTLELVLGALVLTVGLVTPVAAVVPAVTDGGDQRAVPVLALELSLPADSLRTRVWLVRPVLAVHGAVTDPPVGDTLLVLSSTAVLTSLAVRHAGSVVPRVQ